jgi:hypothetical protein
MPVERLRAKGRLMNIELSERDKTQPIKKEENRYLMEGEERRCRMCYDREIIEYMWNGCSERRESERKERGEILHEDGREIRDME